MSATEQEIATQPEIWRRAAAHATAADILPAGARIALIGCGTSYFVAQSIAALREGLGAGETDAFVASEAPIERRYDRIVAISRSGTTTEVSRALARVSPGVETVALTAVADTPIPRACSRAVVLDFADERSVVQTRFATTALALMRASLGDDIEAVAADGERALADPLPLTPDRYTHHVYLGTGWCVGLASEAALKIREAAQAWSEAYPAMEYRHGPIAVAGPESAVWLFGAAPEGLAADIAATGATVIASTLDPLAQLVQAQRAAVALAHARGLDPDNPRNLTRSVVLP